MQVGELATNLVELGRSLEEFSGMIGEFFGELKKSEEKEEREGVGEGEEANWGMEGRSKWSEVTRENIRRELMYIPMG